MFGIGVTELLLILVILLLLFGGKKLPELTKSIGESIRDLRRGLAEDAPEAKKTKSKKSS